MQCAGATSQRPVPLQQPALMHATSPRHPPVGSMAAKSGAEARAVKMPSRPSGATPIE